MTLHTSGPHLMTWLCPTCKAHGKANLCHCFLSPSLSLKNNILSLSLNLRSQVTVPECWISLLDRLFDIGRFRRSAAVDLVPMKNTEESESSGSRAVVASPSQENPRHYRMKLDVLGEVLQRLQESSYEEAALPDFEDRLPAR